MNLNADVRLSGPVFNGEAVRRIDDATEDAEKTVAKRGLQLVQLRLPTVLRNPTGHYQSRISVVQTGSGHEVNDDGVVYGPWLEGTGSRNRTTRFKGYATFRRVGQQLDAEAGDIAEGIIERTTRRL